MISRTNDRIGDLEHETERLRRDLEAEHRNRSGLEMAVDRIAAEQTEQTRQLAKRVAEAENFSAQVADDLEEFRQPVSPPPHLLHAGQARQRHDERVALIQEAVSALSSIVGLAEGTREAREVVAGFSRSLEGVEETAHAQGVELLQLAGENRDQGEAIGALMDMLERTVTTDDAHLMLEELGASIAASMQQQTTETEHAMQAHVEEALQAAQRELDAAFEARLQALENRNAERDGQQARALADVEERAERAEAQAAERMNELERLDVRLADQTRQEIEAVRKTTEMFSTGIDNQVAMLRSTLTTRVDEMQRSAEEERGVLKASLQSMQTKLEATIEEAVARFDEQVRDTAAAADTRIAEAEAQVVAVTSKLRTHLDAEVRALADRQDDDRRTAAARLAEGVSVVQKTLEERTGKLDAAVSGLDTRWARFTDGVDKRVKKLCAGLEATVNSENSDFLAASRRGLDEVSADGQQLRAEVAVALDALTASVARIESLQAEASTSLGVSADQLRDDMTTICTETRSSTAEQLAYTTKEYSGRHEALSTQVDVHRQEFLESSREQDRLREQIADLSASTRENRAKIAEEYSKLEQGIERRTTHCEREIHANTVRVQESTARLESEYESLSNSTVDRLENEHKRVDDLCGSLESRVDSEVRSLRTSSQSDRQVLSEAFSKSEQKAHETLASLAMNVSETQAHHTSKQDHLQRDVAQLQLQLATFKTSVTQLQASDEMRQHELRQSHDQLQESLDSHISIYEEHHNNFGARTEQRMGNLSDTLSALRTTVDEKVAAIQQTAVEMQATVNERRAGLQRELTEVKLLSEKNQKELALSSSTFDRKLDVELSKLRDRVQEMLVQMQDAEETMRLQLDSRGSAHEQRVENMRSYFLNQVCMLESKFDERNDTQDKRADEFQQQTMSKLQAISTAIKHTDDAQTSSYDTLRGEVVEVRSIVQTCRQTSTDVCCGLDRRIADSIIAQEQTLDQHVFPPPHPTPPPPPPFPPSRAKSSVLLVIFLLLNGFVLLNFRYRL
jgi:hypothetical protein